MPPRDAVMFLPRQPYLPLGSLRCAVSYPAPADAFADADVAAAFARVGLADLVPSLDRDDRWDRILSHAEQQRLSVARLVLHKPRWIFLDDATGALDDAGERELMAIIDRELAGAAVFNTRAAPGFMRPDAKRLELTARSESPRRRSAGAPHEIPA
jgi:putative ATP-binding cassette transporter